jgi:hypothetical protein
MRKIILLIVIIVAISLLFVFKNNVQDKALSISSTPSPSSFQDDDTSQMTIIAENLDTPWAIAFLGTVPNLSVS